MYWQSLFNTHGFACDNSIRWQIWDDARIEPWYRQNIFWARRNPENAGHEPRLKAVIHPGIYNDMIALNLHESRFEIERGSMSSTWYVTIPARAAVAKVRRFIHGRPE